MARAKVRGVYEITIGQTVRKVEIAHLGLGTLGQGTRYGIRVDGGPVQLVEATRPQADVLSLLVEDAAWEAGLVPTDDGFDVELLGLRHQAEVVDPKRKALRLAVGGGSAAVKTAMPGRIVRILVEEGAPVAKGQPLVVVEAMKMENELKAPREGVVKRVAVRPGDTVEAGMVLVELEG